MFEVSLSDCSQIRQTLVHAYQEQGPTQKVKFICRDGTQLCSQQLAGRAELKNPPEFNYNYSKKCIKSFLDSMHNIKITLDWPTLLELIKFLKFENKDSSQFEKKLLAKLMKILREADISMDLKLLTCLYSRSFDDFDIEIEKDLFGESVSEDLTGDLTLKLLKLDLTQTENAQVKELINCSESISYTDDEIESSIFLMIKKMKKNKTPDIPIPGEEKIVQIKFYNGNYGTYHWKTVAIDTSKTAEEMTDMMNNMLKPEHQSNPFVCFKFNGTKLEGDLKKYKLKNEDIIHYWLQNDK